MDTRKNVLLLGSGGASRAFAERLKKSSCVERVLLSDGTHEQYQNTHIDLIIGSGDPRAADVTNYFLKCGSVILGATKDIALFDVSTPFSVEVLGALNVPMVDTIICHSKRRALTIAREMFAASSHSPSFKSETRGRWTASDGQEGLRVARAYIEEHFERLPMEALLLTCDEGSSEIVMLHVLCAGVDTTPRPEAGRAKKESTTQRGEVASTHYILLNSEIPEYARSIAQTFVPPFLRYWAEENARGFRGILSVEILITQSGPKLLKYHIGPNDLQRDVILSAGTGEYDFYDLCYACANGSLQALVGKNQLGRCSSTLQRESSSAAA